MSPRPPQAADGSIFLALWPLPAGLALHPLQWTQLIHGNASITAGLFAMR